jgi:hypothetical protein
LKPPTVYSFTTLVTIELFVSPDCSKLLIDSNLDLFDYLIIADASEAPEECVYPVRVENLHGGGAQGDLQVRGLPDLSGALTGAGGTCAETGAQMFKIKSVIWL